jgi:chromosome segregation protein
LLKLRKVEVLGFKSFFEKTHLKFSGTGLTCIVGPNGCGKSNIVDAISWVLGEQSHKSLRAERMSDCIFNGTAKRPPLGMAEVLITLEDPELAEAARFVLDGATAESGQETVSNEVAGVSTELIVDEIVIGEAGSEDSAGAGAETPVETIDAAQEKKPFGKKRAQEKPVAHAKLGEVVVGRRLYRSGQSEYLINGRVARLRDVQEVFMGVGLGPDSYAIIEQGRIGQVLSSRPTDRRAIIEEAAGVTKFKTKKRLAEAKLESSKLNLARVNDILVEVEKQLASLKRQASKARRYTELRELMRGALRQLLASKATELDTEATRLAQLLTELSAEETRQSEELARMETEQERLSQRTYELDAELRLNQNVLGQTALELDRAENRIVFNRQRGTELDARRRQAQYEIEQTVAQATQLAAQVSEHQRAVDAAREETTRVQLLLEQITMRAQESSADAQATEARIEELRRTASELGEELTRFHGERAQAEQSLALQMESLGRIEETEHQLLEESVLHRDRSHAADLHLESAMETAQQLTALVGEMQTTIAARRTDLQAATTQSESARDQLAEARARRASLEQVLNDRSYTTDAVQKLFAANGSGSEKGFQPVGVLADYAEVEEKYESAVEQFLRDELEYVVVETFDHARAGIQMLREEVGGRATFFVDSLKKLNLSPNEAPIPFHAEADVVSRLDKLVEFRDPLGAAAKQFLPRLQSAFLVETATAAERLARENKQYHFVTPDGTTYQGRMVSGGRPAEAGPLVLKREMRLLEAEVARLERAAADAQSAVQRLTEELRRLEQSLVEATARHVDAEKTVVSATHLRDQARADLARLSTELTSRQTELDRLRKEVKAARQRAETALTQHAEATRARASAETEAVAAGEWLIALRRELAAQQEEIAERRAEAATLAERLASAEAIAERLAASEREVRERELVLSEQLAGLEREQNELASQTGEHERQVSALREEKARLETLRVALEQEWEQARVRTVEVDDTLRMARQTLGDLREERGKHEIERARNDSDREYLRQSCMNELNAPPEDLIAEFPTLLSGEELAAAEANYQEMKSKIESMGPVNMMALEEYNECEQRFTFLSREKDDLMQSIADTQQAITELDEVSQQKFEEAFAVINQNFAEAFRTLFGGGTGEMRLTEADSSGDAGIDIAAQPPGKRLQNVLLLSGGEKALTALALLIAIFRYQPSPFCILDEVDAPLDEANVGRFTQLVAEMSAQTQFIVVTHNRRTMETAPVLYGVTMQEPGVSKLVSVRWDEPVARAASNAA